VSTDLDARIRALAEKAEEWIDGVSPYGLMAEAEQIVEEAERG
jgi:hypothetical protein